jgi:hypothetical protein
MTRTAHLLALLAAMTIGAAMAAGEIVLSSRAERWAWPKGTR